MKLKLTRVLFCASCLTFVVLSEVFPASTFMPLRSSRFTIFISDLHLGVGRTANGEWDNYEDGRWAADLKAFLTELGRRVNGSGDLIINGDFLELWQSLESKDCIYPDKNLSCTETEALKRLSRVVSNHSEDFAAIRDFAAAGSNTVVIVPGNHDVALLFDKVSRTVLAAINAPAGKVRVATEGYWISPDHLIYAEHGQQIGEDLNKFENWPKPFRTVADGIHLQRPWGEQFVQKYYNDFEKKYPAIDNFTDDLGIRYGLAAEGASGAIEGIGRFIYFQLAQVSWHQVNQTLGGSGNEPELDIRSTQQNGDRFLLESLSADDPARTWLQEAQRQNISGLPELSEDAIKDICSVRAAISEEQRNLPSAQQTVPGCGQTLGAASQALFNSRNKIFEKHLDDTFTTLSREGITSQVFQLFVYSHTHVEDGGFTPMQKSGRMWQPTVVNTGAWQRTIKGDALKAVVDKNSWPSKAVLTSLRLEDIPPCYPSILVEPYTTSPKADLRYWHKKGNSWSLDASCN